MPFCTSCGHPTEGDGTVCNQCATAVGQICPGCSQVVPEGHRFCSGCGYRLTEGAPAERSHHEMLESLRALMPPDLAARAASAPPPIAGERREVTVLLLDITNFTAQSYHLDSEDIFSLVDEALRKLVDVLHRYEGIVDKFTGDGFMALFGAPVAHENDPERAVRAALEMLETIAPIRERIQETYGFDLRIRIGINTGEVVAGNVGGNSNAAYTVMGNTANLTSRLESAAEPGTVLVGEETYQRTAPLFEYMERPSLVLPGIDEPLRCYRPLERRSRPDRVRGLPGLEVPLIGRQDVLDQMGGAADQVLKGRRGRYIMVSGEAGVGKSRVVREFSRRVDGRGFIEIGAACQAYTRSRPLWLIAELMRNLLHLSENDDPSQQLTRLQDYLGEHGLDVDSLVPYLANALELPLSRGQRERLRMLDAAMLQKQTHAALRQLLVVRSRAAPMILVLDDLHWIDPASRDFLVYLINTSDPLPILAVLVSRDAERKTVVQPILAALEERGERVTDIPLETLSLAEGSQLVDRLIPDGGTAAVDLKQRIVERAGGNPFYTEEIVRMLLDRGGLEQHEEGWQVTATAAAALAAVPGTLKGLILTRFDRLDEALRRVLQRATVLGAAFPVPFLASFSGVPLAEIEAQIADLVARDYLTREPFGNAPGCRFRHALLQEAIYSTLLKRDLQRLHARAAEQVGESTFWTPEEKNEQLAYHHSRGPEPTAAVPYLLTAGDNAARRYANETAVEHYQRALSIISAEPAGFEEEFYRARLGLGESYKFLGRFAEAISFLERLLKYLRRDDDGSLDDGARIATVVKELGDVHLRSGALDEALEQLEMAVERLGVEGAGARPRLWRSMVDRMAWVHLRRGRPDAVIELIQSVRVDDDAVEMEDAITFASLYNAMGGSCWQQGNLADAITYVERSLRLYQSQGYLYGVASAHNNLAILYVTVGNWKAALSHFEVSDKLRQQTGDIRSRADNLDHLGTLRTLMGEHEAALRDLEAGLEIRQQLGDSFGSAQSHFSLAHLALIQGRLQAARTHAERALALSNEIGSAETEVQALWVLGLALADSGESERGLAHAERALAISRESGLTEKQTDSLRAVGLLRARQGQMEQALSLLEESAELCRAQNDPYRLGQAQLERARLLYALTRQGGPEARDAQPAARDALAEAIERFEMLGAAHDLRQARELERQMADQHRESSRRGTRQQAAVLHMALAVAPGQDDEIAWANLATTIGPLIEIAEKHGGYVDRHDQGLAALFGVPQVHEDDAARAVAAAWEMAERLDQSGTSYQAAIAYGPVIALTHPHQTRLMLRGEPIRLASQVAGRVPPGRIWVQREIERAAEHLHHFSRGENGWVALAGPRQESQSPRGLPGRRSRLVGRQHILDQIAIRAGPLAQGEGGFVWIEGEAGIGKSRLIEEFVATLDPTEMLVLQSQGSSHRVGRAFSLVSELLSRLVDQQPADSPEQSRARLYEAIREWPESARQARPVLEMLLGIRPGGEAGEQLARLEPEQLRQQIFVALRGMIKSLAEKQPLLLILDDLHWADPMSVDLLGYLSHLSASYPILFVLAHRSGEIEGDAEKIEGLKRLQSARSTHVALSRLNETESRALLDSLFPEAALADEAARLILSRCAGNPYYLEEFARMLLEQGRLHETEGRWTLAAHGQEEEQIPTSLEALLQARVAALRDESRDILEWASVIGEAFDERLMRAATASANVAPGLEDLAGRGLLERDPEKGVWQFSHPLIERVVYQTLVPSRRRTLHLRIAELLEARWKGVEFEHAEELARHYTQAGASAKTVQYGILAGERALARYAVDQALVYFRRSAQLLDGNVASVDRARLRIAAGEADAYAFQGRFAEAVELLQEVLPLVNSGRLPPTRRAAFYRRLGRALQKQHDLPAAQAILEQGLELVRESRQREAQSEASRLLVTLGWNHFHSGQMWAALHAGLDGLHLAQRVQSLNEAATAANFLGGVFFHRGDFAQASEHTSEALSLREKMGYTWGVASTYNNLGILSVAAGTWDEALRYFERSLELRQEIGDAEGIVITTNNLGFLARDQGRLEPAERFFSASLEQSRALELHYHQLTATLGLAEICLLQERHQEARTLIRESHRGSERLGAQNLVAESSLLAARLLLAEHEPEDALKMARRATIVAAELNDPTLATAAWRHVTECNVRLNEIEAARRSLLRAREAEREDTNMLERGRVLLQSARLHMLGGRSGDAHEDVEQAREIFVRLGAKLELERCETMRRWLVGS